MSIAESGKFSTAFLRGKIASVIFLKISSNFFQYTSVNPIWWTAQSPDLAYDGWQP